tara:strand:+ start:313 stop:438 length:126 start_codon:yes stop_codon:yes gene_type:complete
MRQSRTSAVEDEDIVEERNKTRSVRACNILSRKAEKKRNGR